MANLEEKQVLTWKTTASFASEATAVSSKWELHITEAWYYFRSKNVLHAFLSTLIEKNPNAACGISTSIERSIFWSLHLFSWATSILVQITFKWQRLALLGICSPKSWPKKKFAVKSIRGKFRRKSDGNVATLEKKLGWKWWWTSIFVSHIFHVDISCASPVQPAC